MSDAPTREQVVQEVKRRLQAEAQARAALNAEAARVMDTSQPTPTQDECDAIKLGLLHPDEKGGREAPEMMPLGEQQHRIAEAGGGSAEYRTRAMSPGPSRAAQPAHRQDASSTRSSEH